MVRFLPVMQTDTLLKYRDQVLIIDTKYYEKILRDHYDKAILHSENLYQIFTYVKNLDVTGSGKVRTTVICQNRRDNFAGRKLHDGWE